MSNYHITNKDINQGDIRMKRERDITIKVIYNNKINHHRLVEYFARKYIKQTTNKKS